MCTIAECHSNSVVGLQQAIVVNKKNYYYLILKKIALHISVTANSVMQRNLMALEIQKVIMVTLLSFNLQCISNYIT